MKSGHTVNDLDAVTGLRAPLHLAVGMFDGVHLGHQAVVEAAIQSASRTWGVAGVLTFNPHPSRLFRPDQPTLLMMPFALKASFLHYLGIDWVIQQTFDAGFAAIEAERFPLVLKEKLPSLAALYVGENFRFGKKRSGTVADLVRIAKTIDVIVYSIERIKQNGQPISSTRIRDELVAGNIEAANNLLGYTYRSEGVVVPGKQIGRTIGFPTLNMRWDPELKPRFGVYAVRVKLPREDRWLPAVANYGVRPTVSAADPQLPLLEVHLLGETSLVAGVELYVEWYYFIRPEQKFASFDQLKAQIVEDKAMAQQLLG